eukprot:gnl/Spiro4/21997_TR10806_c0_g1_i1.p1 gnl/Spiro4/21997_TR10806_c0_g1~~gnl/Spiro4/21997_TR10806_c0_g1_i1.p1  ORF type:complete len:218 (-),score=11.53 gnl/Spiro4/21997_TR10806_c0_g1_i1:72-725(-)
MDEELDFLVSQDLQDLACLKWQRKIRENLYKSAKCYAKALYYRSCVDNAHQYVPSLENKSSTFSRLKRLSRALRPHIAMNLETNITANGISLANSGISLSGFGGNLTSYTPAEASRKERSSARKEESRMRRRLKKQTRSTTRDEDSCAYPPNGSQTVDSWGPPASSEISGSGVSYPGQYVSRGRGVPCGVSSFTSPQGSVQCSRCGSLITRPVNEDQ